MADYAIDESAESGARQTAICCCSSTRTPEQWYLAYGDEMASYVDNDLSILFEGNPASLSTRNAGSSVTGLYKGLLSWYASNIPAASHEEAQTQPVSYRQEERMSFGSDFADVIYRSDSRFASFSARDGATTSGGAYYGGSRPGFWSGHVCRLDVRAQPRPSPAPASRSQDPGDRPPSGGARPRRI